MSSARTPALTGCEPLPLQEEVVSTTARSDGRVLALGEDDGTIALIDAGSLRPISRFRVTSKGPALAVGYVPRSSLLVVGGEDGFLALVDSRTGAILQRLAGHSHEVAAIGFSADGRAMVTMAGGSDIQLWRLRAGRPVRQGRPYFPSFIVMDVSLSSDGRTLVATKGAGVDIIDVSTGHVRARLPGTERGMLSARFTPDGRYVAAVSIEGWTRLWSTRSRR